MLAGRRQLSLDETGRRRLRRQTSEIRPIIAWQESFRESVEKQQSQVEVVAKKIGQPKPTPARPLRSPSIRNESCLTLSRRQVAERLKVGWNKTIAKGNSEAQDKGRQNLNIFLNKSFEARPESPHTPELGNGFRRSQSLYCPNDEEDCNSDSSTESDSDDDHSIEHKDPQPRAGTQQSEPPAPTQPPPPQQQHSQGPPQQRLSASARRAVFKAAGRQRPTTCSPEPKPRLMSAPPQPVRPPSAERSRSAPLRRRAQRRPRRGVEGGEVVTMVSLVSPAESEEEEVLHPLQCPPTPEAPPTPVKPPTPCPPPPPVLSLRRPPKAVTFKSSMGDGPQFRTSYPTKSPTILQEDKETPEIPQKTDTPPTVTICNQPRPLVQRMGKPHNTLPSKPKPLVLQRQSSKQAADRNERTEEMKKKCVVTKIPEPIQEEPAVEVSEKDMPNEKKEVENNTELTGGEPENEDNPDFKSPKERECWQLFKRMSSRGVSVSFETVLRGLLTPTEYRMRRAALMASC